MSKKDLVDKLAKSTGLTRIDIDKMLDANAELMIETLNAGEEFLLVGIGKARRYHLTPRIRRNPVTGQEFVAPARHMVKVRVAKTVHQNLVQPEPVPTA